MLVKCIEKREPQLEVHPLSEFGVLGYRKVQILAVRTSQVGDARAAAGVTECSGAG